MISRPFFLSVIATILTLPLPAQAISDAELATMRETITALQERVVALEAQVRDLKDDQPAESASAPAKTGTGAAEAAIEESAPARAVAQREAYQRDEVLRQQDIVLMPQGDVEVELGVQHAYTSSDFINIDGFSIPPVLVVGDIVSEQVDRWTVTPFAATRVGLPYGLQADMRVPYSYEREERVAANGAADATSDAALGDITLALSRGWSLPGGWPDLVSRIAWKTTTGDDPFDAPDPQRNPLAVGSGFHGLQGTVTWIKPADPAILYGSVGYTWNMEDDKNGQTIDPGDSVSISAGTAWAMSHALTMNFGLSQRYTMNAERDGVALEGSSNTSATFNTGISYMISPDHALDVNLGIGLSEDAPDYLLTVSSPIRVY